MNRCFLPILAALIAASLAGQSHAEKSSRCESGPQRELQRARAEADGLRKALAELKAKDAATLADLAQGLADAERRASELEQAGEQLRRDAKANALREQELVERLERSNVELAGHAARIEELTELSKRSEAQLAKAREEAEGELAKQRVLAKREIEELRRAIETTQAELAEHRILAKRQVQQHLAAADEARAAAGKWRAELEAAQAEHEQALAESRILSKRALAKRLAAEEALALAERERAELESGEAPTGDSLDKAHQASMREIADHLAAAQTAERARPEAEQKRAKVQESGKADRDVEKLSRENGELARKLAKAEVEIERLTSELAALSDSELKARADLVAEQVVRMRLQAQLQKAEAKPAPAKPEPAPPVPSEPAGVAAEPRATPSLAVLRFDQMAGEAARDREQLLKRAKAVLAARPGAQLDIVGHTCNTGNREANLNLSVRRADSVRDFLIRSGIAAESLHTSGAGDSSPVASNDTPEGRRLNRRVEVHVRE